MAKVVKLFGIRSLCGDLYHTVRIIGSVFEHCNRFYIRRDRQISRHELSIDEYGRVVGMSEHDAVGLDVKRCVAMDGDVVPGNHIGFLSCAVSDDNDIIVGCFTVRFFVALKREVYRELVGGNHRLAIGDCRNPCRH